MNCPKCGAIVADGQSFCPQCGAIVSNAQAPIRKTVSQQPQPQPYVVQASAAPVQPELPPQNRPLSPWAYWGLSILYAVPIVGFVFLIVFSFNRSNINRRNFTRSYWCGLLVLLFIAVIVVILALAGVIDTAALEELSKLTR